MASSTRTFPLLLVLTVLALAAAAAGPAHGAADTITPIKELDTWIFFSFGPAGTASDTYTVPLDEAGYLIVTDAWCAGDQFSVNINGFDSGLTSVPSSTSCDLPVGDDPDMALTMREYSHRVYPLTPGTSAFQITTVAAPLNGGGAYFRVGKGVYVDPSLASSSMFKVVTASGKQSTRDAAISACQTAGMTLADPTSATWTNVVNAVRASGALNLNPSDAVIIKSWDGNNYGGVALQLNVRAASGTITNAGVTLLNAPAYPLCQSAPGTALAPAESTAATATTSSAAEVPANTSAAASAPATTGSAASAPATTSSAASAPVAQIARQDETLAIVGPAVLIKSASAMCKSALGSTAMPAVLSAAKPKEFAMAMALAFSVVGADKQVWIGGMERLANEPVVLVTMTTADDQGMVVAPDNVDSKKFVLCKSA